MSLQAGVLRPSRLGEPVPSQLQPQESGQKFKAQVFQPAALCRNGHPAAPLHSSDPEASLTAFFRDKRGPWGCGELGEAGRVIGFPAHAVRLGFAPPTPAAIPAAFPAAL